MSYTSQLLQAKLDFHRNEQLSNHLLHENIQRLKVYMLILAICELLFQITAISFQHYVPNAAEVFPWIIMAGAFAVSYTLHMIQRKCKVTMQRIALNVAHACILIFTLTFVYVIQINPGYGVAIFTMGIMFCALAIVRIPTVMIGANVAAFTVFIAITSAVQNDPIVFFNLFNAILLTVIASFSAILRYRRAREIFEEKNKIQELNEQLAYFSSTDKLTGLANRMKTDEELKKMIQYAKKHSIPLSIILVDIDNFKQINDTYGHQFGDRIMQSVAGILKQNMRLNDFVGRWGGDEFLIICPHMDLSNSFQMAERIKESVAKTDLPNGVSVTVSGGVGQITNNESESGLFSRVDAALYCAKECGRNRMEVSTEQHVLLGTS